MAEGPVIEHAMPVGREALVARASVLKRRREDAERRMGENEREYAELATELHVIHSEESSVWTKLASYEREGDRG